MFPAEVDLDIGVLELPVDVGQVVFDVLVLQRNLVVFWGGPHHALVPDSHTVACACLCRELTNQRCENSVRVPVNDGRQIDVHVERERHCVLFEAAVVQELINLFELESNVLFFQANWILIKANKVTVSHGQVI